MSLIVEDGSGLSNAESYASVAEADAYHAARGNADWEAVDDKEAALRKASDYLTQVYTMEWSGARKSITQSLDWPRQLAQRRNVEVGYQYGIIYYTDSEVPQEVKRACIELALRASSEALLQDLTREVASESIAGAVSVTYREGGERQKRYAAIEAILEPTLSIGSSGIRMMRA